jgi:hypothetical protein
MRTTTKIQLMVMMFLMFFTWGAWYGQMGKYLIVGLGASGDQTGMPMPLFQLPLLLPHFLWE